MRSAMFGSRADERASTDRGAAQARADGSRPQLALLGTVLLLGIGYALLVSAPVVFQRFSLSTGSGGFGSFSNATWLPAAAASGFAVGGAAALLFVLARLVRDIDRQPYACLAPVLAVFTAFVLAGVRAQLPLHGFGSEHFSALAMGVAVLGGALVQMRGVVPGLLGVLVTLAPAATLIGVIASGMQRFDEPAILTLDPKLRLFTVLLTAASLILVATALVSRAIVARVIVRSRARPIPGELTPVRPVAEAAMWQKLRHQADPQAVRAPRITRQQITSAIDSIDIEDLAWTSGFPRARGSRGTPGWLSVVLTLITLVAVGAFGYRAFLWNKNREAQLAMELRANEERQARQFAEAREARAKEVAAAQAQVAAAAAAPAPQDPASNTPVLAAAAVPGVVPAVVTPSLDEQKQKAELEAQADRDAQAARDAEAKAAREAEKAAKAAAAAEAKAERDAKEAAIAERKRQADEAREARHAERERRQREREERIAAAERKRELAARYAAQKKEKADKKERAARDKAVSGMLDGNKDPIFGL